MTHQARCPPGSGRYHTRTSFHIGFVLALLLVWPTRVQKFRTLWIRNSSELLLFGITVTYSVLHGWSNKPPPLARKMLSRLFKYRWASLASKEGALKKFRAPLAWPDLHLCYAVKDRGNWVRSFSRKGQLQKGPFPYIYKWLITQVMAN